MEAADETLVLAVEHTRHGIVVVRVAGDLSRDASGRLARLLDTCVTPRPGGPGWSHLVVDLGEVRTFGLAGLQVIVRAEQACARASMSLHVTGVADRLDALPQPVGSMLAGLRSFPTVEEALDALPAAPELTARAIVGMNRITDARQHARRRPRARVVDGG